MQCNKRLNKVVFTRNETGFKLTKIKPSFLKNSLIWDQNWRFCVEEFRRTSCHIFFLFIPSNLLARSWWEWDDGQCECHLRCESRLNRSKIPLGSKKRCSCTKGRRKSSFKKRTLWGIVFLSLDRLNLCFTWMPSLISQRLLPCLKTRWVWEGGWPWFDSPGRMELCSLLSWIHSNVAAHICTHKTHTHIYYVYMYVKMKWEEKEKKKVVAAV